MRKLVGAKFPLTLIEPVQLDEGAMNPICRSASDINLFDPESFPPGINETIEKAGVSLEDAVFFFRKEEYWQMGLSNVAARQFSKSLIEAGFMRFDLTTRNLGYARLMRDAEISNGYVTTIEEILDNSDYENCRVPDYDTIRWMDLRILNRLNERQQRVIRMSYGLDDTVYDVHQIAKSFKNDPVPVDDEFARRYPKAAHLRALSDAKAGRIMAAKSLAIEALAEKDRDDRREYTAKLLTEVYAEVWNTDLKKPTLKEFDEKRIADYLHRVGLVLAIR